MNADFSVLIDAPREVVFRCLVEPSCVLEWLRGLQEYIVVRETDGEVGTTFRQVWEDDGDRVVMNGTVMKYKSNREFAIHLEGSGIEVNVHYVLDDQDGETLVLQETVVHYSGVMKVIDMIARRFLRKSYLREQKKNFVALAKLCAVEAPK